MRFELGQPDDNVGARSNVKNEEVISHEGPGRHLVDNSGEILASLLINGFDEVELCRGDE